MPTTIFTLDRYEGGYAILIEEGVESNQLLVLQERLIEFAEAGDVLSIEFDVIGNLSQVKVLKKRELEEL
ncbi:hypothetical protein [Thalassobacillus hwangdonensis]|uniref:DUF3006 domain-containing protein n=1 Tax=Thalassobacillus hwangdonensis TaxID=546108 RepID=A0ABW3L7K4_9BACI